MFQRLILLFPLLLGCSNQIEYVNVPITNQYIVDNTQDTLLHIDEEDKEILGFHLNLSIKRFESLCKDHGYTVYISSDNKFIVCTPIEAKYYLKFIPVYQITGNISNNRVNSISLLIDPILYVSSDYVIRQVYKISHKFVNIFGSPSTVDNSINECLDVVKNTEIYNLTDQQKELILILGYRITWEKEKDFMISLIIDCASLINFSPISITFYSK